MPPRKSNVSIVSNGAADQSMTDAAPTPTKTTKDGVGIDDLTLPKSMIARLAKGVLPPNTQIQKDALLALHKSATVFVSYIANAANELTQANQKKTIMPQDVITAIKDVEFEGFLPRLQAELKKYNDIQCDKRNSYRHRVKQEKAAAAAVGTDGQEPTAAGADGDESMLAADTTVITNGDGQPPVKKLKGDDGQVIHANGNDSSLIHEDPGDQLREDTDEDEDQPEDEDEEDGDEIEDEAEDDEDEDEHPSTVINPNGIEDEALDDPDSD